MKYILIIFLIAGGYYFYKKNNGAHTDLTRHDSTRIPRDVFLDDLYISLETRCKDPVRLNEAKITQEYCLQRRTNYGHTCKTTVAAKLPEFIDTTNAQTTEEQMLEYGKCVFEG